MNTLTAIADADDGTYSASSYAANQRRAIAHVAWLIVLSGSVAFNAVRAEVPIEVYDPYTRGDISVYGDSLLCTETGLSIDVFKSVEDFLQLSPEDVIHVGDALGPSGNGDWASCFYPWINSGFHRRIIPPDDPVVAAIGYPPISVYGAWSNGVEWAFLFLSNGEIVLRARIGDAELTRQVDEFANSPLRHFEDFYGSNPGCRGTGPTATTLDYSTSVTVSGGSAVIYNWPRDALIVISSTRTRFVRLEPKLAAQLGSGGGVEVIEGAVAFDQDLLYVGCAERDSKGNLLAAAIHAMELPELTNSHTLGRIPLSTSAKVIRMESFDGAILLVYATSHESMAVMRLGPNGIAACGGDPGFGSADP